MRVIRELCSYCGALCLDTKANRKTRILGVSNVAFRLLG